MSREAFAAEVGVSHVSILNWERGEGIGPFNRMKLLALAKRTEGLDAGIVEALEAAQPEIRP